MNEVESTYFIYFFLISFFIGLIYTVYGSDDKGVDKLDSLLANTQEDTTKANILLKLAAKTNWSDIKSSEEYIKQALEISQQINYTKGIAHSTLWLARMFMEYKFDLSEKLALEALDLAKTMNDSILMAMVYNQLGSLKGYLNHNEDALFYFNKSLIINLRHDQDSAAAAVYSNLGILHDQMSDDTLSISYYEKAAEINQKTENYLWLAINYLNMGLSSINHNRLNDEFVLLQKSLEIAEEHNFNR